MNRSLRLLLLSSAVVLSACAKDKDKRKEASTPAEAIAAPGEMVPIKNPKPATPGKPSPPAPDAPPADPKPPAPPAPEEDESGFNDTQKMAFNAQISCRDGDCNPSVGLLAIVTKNSKGWGAGQCTASLVAPDVLVTNGHCIPSDLVEAGSSCRGRMWIHFERDSAHPEFERRIGCEQVLLRKKDAGLDGSDYAYLKLQRPSKRPALRQSRLGFADKTSYQLHKVNPVRVPDGIAGLFEKVSCLAVHDSAIFPAPLDQLSQTSFFGDCRVIPGNSGSPILADDGTVRGVIYAFVKKDELRKIFDRNGSTLPSAEELSNMNVGSNFACLLLASELGGRDLPPNCSRTPERLAANRARAEAERVRILQPQAETQIAEKREGRSDIAAFGWTLRTSTSERMGPMGLGVPRCVHPANAEPFLAGAKGAELHRPYFFIRAVYDRYLRASDLSLLWGGFALSTETMKLSRATGAERFRLEITDADTAQLEFQGELEACPRAQR